LTDAAIPVVSICNARGQRGVSLCVRGDEKLIRDAWLRGFARVCSRFIHGREKKWRRWKYPTRGGNLAGYDLLLAATPIAPWAKPVDMMDGILN